MTRTVCLLLFFYASDDYSLPKMPLIILYSKTLNMALGKPGMCRRCLLRFDISLYAGYLLLPLSRAGHEYR